MKRHPIHWILPLALLAMTGCVKNAPQPTSAGPIPNGVHAAPRQNVNLTPTRDGSLIVPPGFEGGPQGVNTQIATGKTVRVGLLLPLTGRNAALGKDMQDAATVSLFDQYARLSTAQQQVRVELLPKDTGDNPQQAQVALEQALADGAQLIIGPVFGDATAAIAPAAAAKNVSLVSFTNNTAVAAPGVYTFGFSPEEQAQRVIGYAMRRGHTRIAALVPNTPTGKLVLNAARSTLQSGNMALVAEAIYAPQAVGIENALNQLLPPGQPPAFDTLLLPEGGPALATILRALNVRGVNASNVQLIGTGFWDEANLLRRTNLSGAWLASSPPHLTAQYEQRFAATYGYAPTRISSLAYDAVALAVTLATSGRGFSQSVLTQPAGYSGPANGIFRLNPNGTVQRGLAVLRVDGVNLSVIDDAPPGFTGAAVPR